MFSLCTNAPTLFRTMIIYKHVYNSKSDYAAQGSLYKQQPTIYRPP